MADGNHLIVQEQRSNLIPRNGEEAYGMAKHIAASGLFGCKTADQAFALMLLADAEGMHPAIAARDYHIIEGRPSLRADAMLARFQSAGGKVKWTERSDTKVSAIFSHESGGECPITWTIEMASKVKRYNRKKQQYEALTDNQNWRNYPRQMLTARVISEGVRTVFPGVIAGMYAPEEVQDFDDAGRGDLKPIPTEPANEQTPEPTRSESLIDLINACETMNDLEQLALQKTSDIIAMPEKDRNAAQKAIAAKRKDLANAPKDAEFVERDPEADKAFIEKFCEFVADRPNKETLDALWAKYKERLASIQAADPELYDEAVKADALKQQEFQAAEMAAE